MIPSFNTYFNRKNNVQDECYKFFQIKKEDENINNFGTRLKANSKNCNYNNYNKDKQLLIN